MRCASMNTSGPWLRERSFDDAGDICGGDIQAATCSAAMRRLVAPDKVARIAAYALGRNGRILVASPKSPVACGPGR